MRTIGPRTWLVCGLILWLVVLVRVGAASFPSAAGPWPQGPASALQAPAQPVTPPAPAASYVGEDTCLLCHDDQRQPYADTPHGRQADARTPAAKQGCESCHGPGSLHIEDPINVKPVLFDQIPPAQSTAICVTCHNRGDHALWQGSQHESRGLGCTSCHGVHTFESEARQLKAPTQLELCGTCHREKIAKLDRSGHMPVREGKMECTTCHNVHGTTNVRLLRKGDSIAELCTSCHADKRGPFLWEHAPVRDGCVTCHDPHGSSNERMLVAKPPLMCQRCHVATRHPSTIYDAALMETSARVFARSCVTCHAAIHGSNHPSGQRFTR